MWAFFAFLRAFLEKNMHFCTPFAVNPWIVFHIATCGGARLHIENSLAVRLTSECENRPKTNAFSERPRVAFDSRVRQPWRLDSVV